MTFGKMEKQVPWDIPLADILMGFSRKNGITITAELFGLGTGMARFR